jgi:hypothetical protein
MPAHLPHGEDSIAEIPNLRKLEAEVREGLEVLLQHLADLFPSPIDRRFPFQRRCQPRVPHSGALYVRLGGHRFPDFDQSFRALHDHGAG